jgi:hypothetical protein
VTSGAQQISGGGEFVVAAGDRAEAQAGALVDAGRPEEPGADHGEGEAPRDPGGDATQRPRPDEQEQHGFGDADVQRGGFGEACKRGGDDRETEDATRVARVAGRLGVGEECDKCDGDQQQRQRIGLHGVTGEERGGGTL